MPYRGQHQSQFDPLRPRLSVESLDQLRPVHEDRILVKLLPPSDTEHGLFIPESARNKRGPQRGLVLAVAGGVTYVEDKRTGKRHSLPERVPVTVKPGDEVLFDRWETNQFEVGGDTLFFVFEEQSLLAVIERN